MSLPKLHNLNPKVDSLVAAELRAYQFPRSRVRLPPAVNIRDHEPQGASLISKALFGIQDLVWSTQAGPGYLYSKKKQKFHNLTITPKDVVSVEGDNEEGNVRVVGACDQSEREQLPAGLRRELMPKHVAVIMDGNVRWAQQRGLAGSAGHEAGEQVVKEIIELCCKWGIKILTVFAFSCDNWNRSKVEVDFIMFLIERFIETQLEYCGREGVQVSVIGDTSMLPKSLQKSITHAEETTKDNSRLQFIAAVNYGGQYDILQACKSIALKAKDGIVELEDINKNLLEQELETKCTEFPNPDLLIRTSGEQRISNFCLWQLAYTELYFVPAFWPDFGEADFIEALKSFQKRQRRFGGRRSFLNYMK